MMVSTLLAWPLHAMVHAAEPLGFCGVAVAAGMQDGQGEGEDAGAEQHACVWCMAQAQEHALSGAPAAFPLQVQTSPPPSAMACGLIVGGGVVRPYPRGPPGA